MRVYTFERRARRRIRFLRGREGREQDGEALLRLRVPARIAEVAVRRRRRGYRSQVGQPVARAALKPDRALAPQRFPCSGAA